MICTKLLIEGLLIPWYQGRLSFDNPKSWTIRAKVAIKQNLEVYCMEQEGIWQAHEAGLPHGNFRWFMFLTDFIEFFS